MTIGERIKLYRKQSKLTQKELAIRCNLAEITIRQYEANKYIPKIGNLQKIATALNISLNELFNVKGEQDWATFAVDFPESSVLEIDDQIRVPISSDELRSYRTNIVYLLERLNLDELIAVNSYVLDLLYQDKEPPATE